MNRPFWVLAPALACAGAGAAPQQLAYPALVQRLTDLEPLEQLHPDPLPELVQDRRRAGLGAILSFHLLHLPERRSPVVD
jgi:hypothetical protein